MGLHRTNKRYEAVQDFFILSPASLSDIDPDPPEPVLHTYGRLWWTPHFTF